jgi:two-component system chemotaxis response regulator CheY
MAQSLMLVDASPTVRGVMKQALERAGFSVTLAIDGDAAIELLDGRPVALFICDIAMQGVDGFSFVRYLRQHPRYRSAPVVVLSAESHVDKRQAGRAEGVKAWLTKPCAPSALVDVVQRFCGAASHAPSAGRTA